MKKLSIVLLVTLLLSLALAYTVYAGEPVGACPDGFTLHDAAHHDDHHMDGDGNHLHVGADTDLNGDGWICVKHVSVTGNVHLHVDNVVPLP